MTHQPNSRHAVELRNLNSLWAHWLEAKMTESFNPKAYFVTMTFARNRDRYLAHGGDRTSCPTRYEVAEGLTATMPKYDACLEHRADVHRWYLRVLRQLLGGQYLKHFDRHPQAIGYIDEPVFKNHRSDTAIHLKPGDEFPHIHMVMVVDGLPSYANQNEVAWQTFERLYEHGNLQAMWRARNPDGIVHVEPAYDIAGALDYASKSAKRDPLLEENQILLPFARSKKVTVLN